VHATIKARIAILILASLAPPAFAAAQRQGNSPLAELASAIAQGRIRVVDLTHSLDAQAPYWPEGNAPSPFKATVVATYQHDGYFARQLQMPEHFGTHMDAPAHFDPKGTTLDRIPAENFVAPAVVVDVSEAVKADADYRVTARDIEKWEEIHGPIPRGSLVLFRTGWAERWPSQARYMNRDAQGVMHFPGLSVEAAHYLVDHVKPVGIGIDTGSIDYGPSKHFEAHQVTMSAGLYHLENVANLGELPLTGAVIIALPLKLRGGSGSPTRVVALVPRAQ
jgi:kynurenine formamidase